MPRSRGNPTGFDVSKYTSAASSTAKDPWARAEQWRYTGPFSRWNRFKGGFPGLGIATVAFAAYCGYEYMFLNKTQHGHSDDSHGEGHH